MRLKLIWLCLIISLSTSALAVEKCRDANLVGLNSEPFGEIASKKGFRKLFEGSSVAPAGYPDVFGSGETICKAVNVIYVEHIKSKTVYAMFTTHDDYCDGGNTIGIMLDMEKYRSTSNTLEEAVVGKIGDGEFYCEAK